MIAYQLEMYISGKWYRTQIVGLILVKHEESATVMATAFSCVLALPQEPRHSIPDMYLECRGSSPPTYSRYGEWAETQVIKPALEVTAAESNPVPQQ
jgi:hypothetical protein